MSEDEAQKTKPRKGRPRYAPTDRERQQVRLMVGLLGAQHEAISAILGITPPTLRKYFRRELDAGEHQANAKVAESLFRQATHPTKPNVVASIFWLKCRAGWRDHDAGNGMGKKELQQEEAQKAAEGRRFAPGSAPPALTLVRGDRQAK